MPTKISISDLTHMGQTVSANTSPLGPGLLAAYAKQELGDKVDIDIFRYPDDFARHAEKAPPDVAGFSVYSWNMNLSYEYARVLKKINSSTITVFGGPNFPTDSDAQREFLMRYPDIDFYVEGEGELAFVELLKLFETYGHDAAAIRDARALSPNLRYVVDGELVVAPLAGRMADINAIPSPYTNGMMDKFFDDMLAPMLETTRGCPFSCTFCDSGELYYNKVRRYSMDRIAADLDYIAARSKVNELQLADLNFGMMPGDSDVANYVAKIQEKHDFPRFLCVATAKNNKERIIDIVNILHGAFHPGASVQSTDPNVLKAIKRKNLPLPDLIEVATSYVGADRSFQSEVILCLPADSKEAHLKSNFDMMDAGMTIFRNHQFMLLTGTEAASKESRAEFEMETRFRVQPRCFGHYEFADEQFSAAEAEEICVGNNTMSYSDYQDCRAFDLTLEVFVNDSMFDDLILFLDQNNVTKSDFIMKLYDRAMNDTGPLGQLFTDFRNEEMRNLWQDFDALSEFLKTREGIDDYIEGRRGNNEVHKYRALSIFRHMEELHDFTHNVAEEMISLDEGSRETLYLHELKKFNFLRKRDFVNPNFDCTEQFHFDFMTLMDLNFDVDPMKHHVPGGFQIRFYHSDRQRDLIEKYLTQYGSEITGLGRMLYRAKVSDMYRTVEKKL